MRNPPGKRFAYLALGLVLLTMMIMDFNGRMTQLRRLEAEREIVRSALIHLLEIKVDLERRIDDADTSQTVEGHARVDNLLLRPGDIPIIPVAQPGGFSQPAPAPVVVPDEPSNLERWASLFTGLARP